MDPLIVVMTALGLTTFIALAAMAVIALVVFANSGTSGLHTLRRGEGSTSFEAKASPREFRVWTKQEFKNAADQRDMTPGQNPESNG